MNWEKIIEDSKSGLLDDWFLMVDNDSCMWCYEGASDDDDWIDMELARVERTYGKGSPDVVEVLDAVGVNAGRC